MDEFEYFQYLRSRSKLSIWLRRFLFRPAIKAFRGEVLDVGCGIGEFLTIYGNGYGIDTNRYCIKYCQENGLRCSVGSAYVIPYESNRFDGVFSSHVLEHLEKPEVAIKEMLRVLKPGGRLILIVPCKKGFAKDPTHVKFWDEESLRSLLNKFNVSITGVKYLPLPKPLKNVFTYNELTIIGDKK